MLYLCAITVAVIIVSFLADRRRTLAGLKKGIGMFMHGLPALLNIIIVISIVLAVIPRDTIALVLGKNSGMLGISIAAVAGSIALIPGFIAFPLAAVILANGAAYGTVAVFLTTLMMVGIVTLPLEAGYFGMRTAVLRNALSFVGALIIGTLVALCM